MGGPARAQVPPELPPEERDSTPEPFPAVDPYTRNEAEARSRLGYVGEPPFALPGGVTTREVDEVLGGVPILWVETQHFKLGSTLETYRRPGDRIENDKLERELERLEKRLGRLKPPRNELDPWLRLHLYAQRLEELYAGFCAAVGIDPRAPVPGGEAAGACLGQQEKFVVLVLQKVSSLGRYTRRYTDKEQQFAYRFGFSGGGWAFAVAAEALQDAEIELDAALHCYVAFSVVVSFCDAYRMSWGRVPAWFKYGLAHRFSREVDERWNLYEGAEFMIDLREDSWRWEPRVRGLVVNEVLPAWDRMLAWKDWSEMDLRAHMMAWSCVDWLVEREQGSLLPFVLAVSEPLPEGVPTLTPELSLERQQAGIQAAFGASVSELDKAWRAHVERRYPRK